MTVETAIFVAVIAGHLATLGMFLQLGGKLDKLNDRLIDHVLQRDAHQ